MRKTHSVVLIAQALMADPDARHWGTETRKRSGVRSGVMYPVLWRMLGEGWLADGWEDAEQARTAKRPPRRYYRITADGKAELSALLDAAGADPRFRALFSSDGGSIA